MKRKSIILLSSILAGSLLVGGAFAAWAVTDNADPLGINVTPGNISHDDKNYATLSWGKSTKLNDLGNLKVGENRKAGVVYLQSDNEDYLGKFTVKFCDATPSTVEKETTDPKLVDYLNVKVYQGALSLQEDGSLPVGTVLGEIKKSDTYVGDYKKVDIELHGTPAGAPVTVFVNLDVTASGGFTKMQQDNVHLEVDWGVSSPGDESTEHLVYYENVNNWSEVWAFTWSTATGQNNKDFPGVQMAQHNGSIYKVAIPLNMEFIIFSAGDNNDEHKTADIPLTGYNDATSPYYNGSWQPLPANRDYYIVGNLDGTGWKTTNQYKFEINPQNPSEYVLEKVEFEANVELKVGFGSVVTEDPEYAGQIYVDSNDYFPGPTSEEGNLALDAGTYNFYFSPTAKNDWATGTHYDNAFGYGKHLWVVPVSDSPAPAPEDPDDPLVLNVALGEFLNDNAVCYIYYWKEGTGGFSGFAKVVDGHATVDEHYEKLLVLRMPAGSTAPDFGTADNQSTDMDAGTGTLTFQNWGEGYGAKAVFNWVTA